MAILVTSDETEISVPLDFTTNEIVHRQPLVAGRGKMFFERIIKCQARLETSPLIKLRAESISKLLRTISE